MAQVILSDEFMGAPEAGLLGTVPAVGAVWSPRPDDPGETDEFGQPTGQPLYPYPQFTSSGTGIEDAQAWEMSYAYSATAASGVSALSIRATVNLQDVYEGRVSLGVMNPALGSLVELIGLFMDPLSGDLLPTLNVSSWDYGVDTPLPVESLTWPLVMEVRMQQTPGGDWTSQGFVNGVATGPEITGIEEDYSTIDGVFISLRRAPGAAYAPVMFNVVAETGAAPTASAFWTDFVQSFEVP